MSKHTNIRAGTLAAVCALVAATAAAAAPTPSATAPSQAAALAASFDYAPATPAPGQEVTLTATSTSPSTAPIRHSWDLDGDGQFDDGEGAGAKTSFASGGNHVVRLRAVQPSAAGVGQSVAERTIAVGGGTGQTPPPPPPPAPPAPPPPPAPPAPPPPPAPANQAPVARYDKQCKKVGTLLMCGGLVAREGVPKVLDASPSTDADGSIVRYEWDLDGGGDFERDGGATPTTTHTFEALGGLVDPRKRVVRVRVTDDKGATAIDQVTLSLLEPACQPGVAHGVLKATSICLRKRTLAGGTARWYGTDPVVLNGITVEPLAGSTFVLDLPQAGSPEIKVNRAAVSVPAKEATARLFAGRVAWKLTGARLTGFELDGQATLNGLRITGLPSAPELLADGTSKLAVHVALPQQFGGSTSDNPVALRPGGAAPASGALSFGVANAALGPIGLKQLKVSYDGVDLWEIVAEVALPEPIPYAIKGDAGIRGGAFEHAGAGIDLGSPGIGPFGPVFLQKIHFRIEINPKQSECVPHVGTKTYDMEAELKKAGMNVKLPAEGRYVTIDYGVPTFALCGGVGLTAGPQILGAAAIRLDAGLGFATYADRPHVLRAFGKIYLVEIPLANADLEVHTDGYVKMLARFHWGIEDLASLRGFVRFEMLAPKFNAEGRVEACLEFVDWCAGARALVSSKGVAVCAKIDVLVDDWEPGFGYRWGDTFPTLYLAGCDVGPYREHIKRSFAGRTLASAGAASYAVDLPAGLPGAVVALEGRTAAPKVTLVGPKGERITTPEGLMPVEQSPFFVLKDPRAKLTQVAISKPSAGRWRVEVEPDSSEIVSLRSAEGLEEPQITARVTGRGRNLQLAYRIKPLKGQKVTFSESGPSTGGAIGVATGTGGTLRFTPAEGRAERREIVAVVEQDGQLRDRIVVATYRAPAVQRPGRPGHVRLVRTRSAATATWPAAARAHRYSVAVRLSDGRRLAVISRQRRLRVPLGPAVTGTVTVRGITASGVSGPATVARLVASRPR